MTNNRNQLYSSIVAIIVYMSLLFNDNTGHAVRSMSINCSSIVDCRTCTLSTDFLIPCQWGDVSCNNKCGSRKNRDKAGGTPLQLKIENLLCLSEFQSATILKQTTYLIFLPSIKFKKISNFFENQNPIIFSICTMQCKQFLNLWFSESKLSGNS